MLTRGIGIKKRWLNLPGGSGGKKKKDRETDKSSPPSPPGSVPGEVGGYEPAPVGQLLRGGGPGGPHLSL